MLGTAKRWRQALSRKVQKVRGNARMIYVFSICLSLFFLSLRSSLIPPQRLTKIQCTDGRRLSELTHAEGVCVDAPDDLTECAQSLDNVALAAMIKERYG